MSEVRVRLVHVWKEARRRDAGYLDDALEHSRLDIETLVFDEEEYQAMQLRWPVRHGIRGLGDIVHAFAHPIARAIDAMAGTDLKNCKDCEKKREDLNERFPI